MEEHFFIPGSAISNVQSAQITPTSWQVLHMCLYFFVFFFLYIQSNIKLYKNSSNNNNNENKKHNEKTTKLHDT
jgi:phosphotransferase system  glucose/maltose/N-acetylglucosamine-specific IIC component